MIEIYKYRNTVNDSKSIGSKDEWSTVEHALAYLNKTDNIPHRTEGEAVLLDHIPKDAKRILDLGTGDGRLIRLLKIDRANMEAVALDTSPTMLKAARQYFSNDSTVKVVKHDLSYPLHKSLGRFDAVVSSLAIHHLPHERKRSLYEEIYDILNPTIGVFCNLDNVASPSMKHHIHFLHVIGFTPETESKSDKLLSMETQLRWLRDIGFVDVDCYWKWLEMALLIGYRKQQITSFLKNDNPFPVWSFDPQEALSKYKPGLYDLVILDIKMPKMDGFELYQEIKKIDNNANVCFLTASEQYYEEFRQKEYHALNRNLFIRKPIENEELVKEINKMIKR